MRQVPGFSARIHFAARAWIAALVTLLPLIGLLSLTSCRNAEIPDRQTFVVAISAAPKTLDPRYTTDAVGQRLVGLVFNSLVRIGPDLKIVGDAAESWTYRSKTYTFRLRPHLSFSNGRPLAADDLRYTFDFYRSSQSPFQSAFSIIESVDVDENELHEPDVVKIKLKEFSAAFLTDLFNIRFLPHQEIQKDPDLFLHLPIGTGSFAIESLEVNQIHLKGRLDHPYRPPKMAHVVFKIIQDDGTRYLKTRKGGIDLVQSDMPLNKIKDFENLPDFKVWKTPGLATDYILFNLQDPVLNQKAVREAFADSVNRDDVIRYKLNNLATPARTILSPTNPFFSQALSPGVFDLKHARSLVQEKHLQSQEFILKTSNNPEAVEKSKVLVHQFEEAGLHVNLQSFEWGTFYSDISKGNFQIAIMRWTGVTDPDIFRLAFHSREIPASGHGRNRGSYRNVDLDPVLDQGLKEIDSGKRKKIYARVQEAIAHDIPIIPLWHEDQVAIVHRRVQDYYLPLNGDYSALFDVSKSE